MSYDLQIYSATEVDVPGLVALIRSANLQVDESSSEGSLRVCRGARRTYTFTLEGPLLVEAADVPDEVMAPASGATRLYEVLIEGSSPTSVRHANAFARRLARASDGVVHNPQTGEVWSSGRRAAPAPIERGRTAVIELRWYTGTDPSTGRDPAEIWLMLARRLFPEMRPRRYGTYEPLQERLDDDSDTQFIEFVADTSDSVFFALSRPAVWGSISSSPGRDGPFRAHRLSVLAEPLADENWRRRLKDFFCEFATKTGAVLATAEIQRDVVWNGRSLGSDRDTEETAFLAPKGRWHGLPPYPVWWTWFGREYAEHARLHLPAEQLENRGPGVFHALCDLPADRDHLKAVAADAGDHEHRWWRRAYRKPTSRSWMPRKLLATIDTRKTNVVGMRLFPAENIPTSLR